MANNKFGIYFNTSTGEILRINSPYWIPEAAEWLCLTDEVNTTLTEVRHIIESKNLFEDVGSIQWGTLPLT